MGFLEQLEWRNATKGFDSSKPVAQSDLDKILKSIQLAPTSYGLQPFRVEVVTNPALKDQICNAGWKQKQFTSCSHVIVFISRTDVLNRIGEYLNLVAGGNPAAREAMKGYEGMMRGSFEGKSREQLNAWAQKQIYIALGFAMAACAELKVDSCPMEGFMPPEVDRILGVKDGEFSTVILTVGYRDPALEVRPKVRFPKQELISFK